MSDAQIEALAVETRRQILTMLLERPRSVQEIADRLPVSRPAVSQHLKKLVDAGLATAQTSGTRNVYGPDPDGLVHLRDWADQLWSAAVDRFAHFVESEEKGREMPTTTIQPVIKTHRLPVSPHAAFDLFTRRIDDWWPRVDFSVTNDGATKVRLEPEPGGRILEITPDGDEHEWGLITEWDEGRRVAFTWHPGQSADLSTEVEVSFKAAANGSEMILVHTGWEVRGEGAAAMRDNYETGWDTVLAAYLDLTLP